MSTKTEAKICIEAAASACDKSLAHWQKAIAALNGTVSINGFGVIHDRFAFRQKLYEAQARITASLAALDAAPAWPSSPDYDEL